MKLYLLFLESQDGDGEIFGVFDSREKAEAAMALEKYLMISCATIMELELNTIQGRERTGREPVMPEWMRKAFETSPWASLVPPQ